MSLNSLQDSMSRRAASMAAMAKRATNPQDIQAIQKSLVTGVQNGSIQPYIGIPLIQELTQKLTEAKAKMAQGMAGAGMPQGQEGVPIAQQVMQQAAQADQSQGLEALPSNLPQEYAGGGIIAFENGGQVERYQEGGGPMGMGGSEIMNSAGTADPYVGKNLLERFIFAPEEPEWKRKLKLEEALREREKALGTKPLVAPPPTPAAKVPASPVAARPLAKDTSNLGLGGDSVFGRKPSLGLQTPSTFAPPIVKSMTAQTMEQLGGYEGADGYLERAAARDKAAEDAIAQAKNSVTGDAFSDYKNVLEKEAKDFGADKEQAKNMAIFKAGLAMMAGTSRHALENIGKGAMVGAEDYQAAAKDIKKAQRENRKELSLIEQSRRAEARGDRDTAIARLEASRDRGDARDRHVSDALQKAYGIDRAQAYDLAKTNYTTQADIFRTNLTGQYGLEGQRISGEYGVRAANIRSREPIITPYQAAQLRAKAEERVDPVALRNQLAKQLGLSKVPAPGADKGFDSKFNTLYENQVDTYFNRFLGMGGGGGGGGGGADPYAGYKLVP